MRRKVVVVFTLILALTLFTSSVAFAASGSKHATAHRREPRQGAIDPRRMLRMDAGKERPLRRRHERLRSDDLVHQAGPVARVAVGLAYRSRDHDRTVSSSE